VYTNLELLALAPLYHVHGQVKAVFSGNHGDIQTHAVSWHLSGSAISGSRFNSRKAYSLLLLPLEPHRARMMMIQPRGPIHISTGHQISSASIVHIAHLDSYEAKKASL
jgi:hypothetical protein